MVFPTVTGRRGKLKKVKEPIYGFDYIYSQSNYEIENCDKARLTQYKKRLQDRIINSRKSYY